MHPDQLQKPQKPLFAVNAVTQGKSVHEKSEANLVDYDGEIHAVIDELGKAHVIVPDVPTEIRQETMALEDELTAACDARDVVRFRAALHAWRLAWMRCLH
jgi:hypothetical protein